jgi:hypothetical protein
MVASSSEFQTKVLRRGADAREYDLYRAALEWDLTEPIVIESRKDLKSEKRWAEQAKALSSSDHQPHHFLRARAGDPARGRCWTREDH